jgi:Protein of unknown function (DUF3142)
MTSGGSAPPSSAPSRAWQTFPRVTLWAWESRQDLRKAPPEKYAIAYLDRTIFITERVATIPRMQPLLVPQSARIMAVVRIEAPRGLAKLNTPQLAEIVADQVVGASRKKQVSALQIDFDATRSQRPFYRQLIEETRKRMPAGMPLSITALASWCSSPGWIESLAVDEAVPMLFRMGGDTRSGRSSGWSYRAGETSCRSSVGVSTDEPWPRIAPSQRIYVFHPGAWNSVALENVEKMIKP